MVTVVFSKQHLELSRWTFSIYCGNIFKEISFRWSPPAATPSNQELYQQRKLRRKIRQIYFEKTGYHPWDL